MQRDHHKWKRPRKHHNMRRLDNKEKTDITTTFYKGFSFIAIKRSIS